MFNNDVIINRGQKSLSNTEKKNPSIRDTDKPDGATHYTVAFSIENPYRDCIRWNGSLIVVHRVSLLFFSHFFETQCHSRSRYRHTPAGLKKKKKRKCGTYILYGRQS